jgi:hypothetical protein
MSLPAKPAVDRPNLDTIAQRRFVPSEHQGAGEGTPHGSVLTVDLGGERMRATVRKVLDPDTVIVEITGVPFTRNHGYKQGDMVGCRRESGLLGEVWRAVNDRAGKDAARRQPAPATEPEIRDGIQETGQKSRVRRRGSPASA